MQERLPVILLLCLFQKLVFRRLCTGFVPGLALKLAELDQGGVWKYIGGLQFSMEYVTI